VALYLLVQTLNVKVLKGIVKNKGNKTGQRAKIEGRMEKSRRTCETL
jgi:hypothetical protein